MRLLIPNVLSSFSFSVTRNYNFFCPSGFCQINLGVYSGWGVGEKLHLQHESRSNIGLFIWHLVGLLVRSLFFLPQLLGQGASKKELDLNPFREIRDRTRQRRGVASLPFCCSVQGDLPFLLHVIGKDLCQTLLCYIHSFSLPLQFTLYPNFSGKTKLQT